MSRRARFWSLVAGALFLYFVIQQPLAASEVVVDIISIIGLILSRTAEFLHALF